MAGGLAVFLVGDWGTYETRQDCSDKSSWIEPEKTQKERRSKQMKRSGSICLMLPRRRSTMLPFYLWSSDTVGLGRALAPTARGYPISTNPAQIFGLSGYVCLILRIVWSKASRADWF